MVDVEERREVPDGVRRRGVRRNIPVVREIAVETRLRDVRPRVLRLEIRVGRRRAALVDVAVRVGHHRPVVRVDQILHVAPIEAVVDDVVQQLPGRILDGREGRAVAREADLVEVLELAVGDPVHVVRRVRRQHAGIRPGRLHVAAEDVRHFRRPPGVAHVLAPDEARREVPGRRRVEPVRHGDVERHGVEDGGIARRVVQLVLVDADVGQQRPEDDVADLDAGVRQVGGAGGIRLGLVADAEIPLVCLRRGGVVALQDEVLTALRPAAFQLDIADAERPLVFRVDFQVAENELTMQVVEVDVVEIRIESAAEPFALILLREPHLVRREVLQLRLARERTFSVCH